MKACAGTQPIPRSDGTAWPTTSDLASSLLCPSRAAAGGSPSLRDVVNRTLGYAYEDYCIAQVARAAGRQADYEYFLARSGNYRLLFDPLSGFMRARRPDGSWVVPFDPAEPNSPGQPFYREGTAWHYLWLVPHDIQGLIVLLGGREAFVQKAR